ncbi:glycosyltransferase family 2 protein [Haloarcula sp. CGMCC 1.2071]|uniref:glycosyltransferase family 2 protein n=1 Tax=Haloarcula sp. CGMCC 1.2071 TaxID=3111454 RepID=UPI00300EB57D
MNISPSDWEYEREATEPTVSVVISTIPSNDHQVVCEYLVEQNFCKDWEIIVVNCPNLDRCEARNFGLNKSQASIVAFTDDDTRPPSDWVQSIANAFEKNDDLVCLEGPVEGGIRYGGERQYVGCNMAVDRDEAIKQGGWNSQYAGWREDTEFGWRMEADAAGICKFVEDATMIHPDSPRTHYDHRLETQLKKNYPRRYEKIFNKSLAEKGWRIGQRIGVVPIINSVRNQLRADNS